MVGTMGSRFAAAAALCAVAIGFGGGGAINSAAAIVAPTATPVLTALPQPNGHGMLFMRVTHTLWLADGEAWATGQVGDNRALARRWDGSKWQTVDIPADGREYSFADGLGASSPDNVVFSVLAVDIDYGGNMSNVEYAVYRWDGTALQRLPDPPGRLSALTAFGSNDLWGRIWTPSGTVLSHWDGATWTPLPLPDGTSDAAIISGADIWAAGTVAAGNPRTDTSVVSHWDGQRWTAVPSPTPDASQLEIASIAATPDGSVVAALAGGNSVLAVAWWHGGSWQSVPLPAGLAVTWPTAVGGSSPNDLWLVAGRVLLHWDGTVWRTVRNVLSPDLSVAGDGSVVAGLAEMTPIQLDGVSARTELARGSTAWLHAGPSGVGTIDSSGIVQIEAMPGATVSHRFTAAGSFTIGPATVDVRPQIVPAIIDPGSRASLRIAERSSASHLADVSVLRPGTDSFVPWRRDVTAGTVVFTPDAGPGVYQLRVRTHRPGDPPSGWSPAVSVRVRASATATPTWSVMADLPSLGHLVAVSGSGSVWAAEGAGPKLVSVSPTGSFSSPLSLASSVTARGLETGAAQGTSLWVINGYGDLYRRQDGTLVKAVNGCDCIGGVHLNSPLDAWSINGGGVVVHVHGANRPRYFPLPGMLTPRAITTDGQGGVWAVGEGIWRLTGGSWVPIAPPLPRGGAEYDNALAFGPEDLWVVGLNLTSPGGWFAAHWNGRRWTQLALPDGPGLPGLTGSSDRDLWIGGDLHWDGRSLVRADLPWNQTPYAHGVAGVTASGRTIASGCCPQIDGEENGVVIQAVPARVTDAGFAQPQAWIAQGADSLWHLSAGATRRHGFRDATGLGLFDSGLRKPATTLILRFPAAGSYTVADPGGLSRCVVQVPIRLSAAGLQLAATPLAGGRLLDVQMQAPGTTGFSDWLTGTTATAVALPTTPGIYLFRARLRNPESEAHSGWSPVRTVTVSAGG